ncbi:hypothetical protein E4U19_005077, partial [Claviceps sp. Clav32 group G5]
MQLSPTANIRRLSQFVSHLRAEERKKTAWEWSSGKWRLEQVHHLDQSEQLESQQQLAG